MDRYPLTTDLAALTAVARHGGIGAAARSLGWPQPQASRAIRRLEHDLGVPLVHRSARGSTLTAEGSLVVAWANEVLEANEHLVAAAASLRLRRAGALTIAASQTIAEELLPRWLAGLRAEYPRIDIALTVTNSAEVGALVSEGGVLGFVESPEVPETVTVPVHAPVVAHDRLVVVTAPQHPWVRRTRPVGVADVAATPLVVREAGSGTRVSLERALSGLNLAPPALELASNVAVRVAVASGAGPAVLSELAVADAVASGELQAVIVPELEITRPLRALWPKGADLPPPGRRLVALARLDARQRLDRGSGSHG
ncbi:MAG: LysR family transcriptional regulator [Propioniciclava sp.]